MGMMLNCDECILDSAVKRKGCVHFNFETNKFEVHNFETDEEMLLFYDNKLSKFKR